MKKHFLLFLLTLLLPLGAFAAPAGGNIGVQLSTTMTKEYGDADPEYLDISDFVIISNTTEDQDITEADLAGVLKFKRKQGQEGEDRDTYDYEVTVDEEADFFDTHEGVTIVATNTGRITITAKPLTAAMIGDIEGDPFTFKAAAWEPTPAVLNGETPLVVNTDFTYTYENNINAGENTAKVKIVAVEGGNYSGTAEKTFTINKRAVTADNLQITLDQDEFTYTGNQIFPVITVQDLTLGDLGVFASTDYTRAWGFNKDSYDGNEAHHPRVKITAAAAGNYTFEGFENKTAYFMINKVQLTISIPEGQKKVVGAEEPPLEVKYDGFVNNENAAALAELEPAQFVVPTLTRVAGENAGVYAISITNADAVVEGARNYDVEILGSGTVNFSIQPQDLSNLEVTITPKEEDEDKYIYNGDEHFMNVVVKDGETTLTVDVDYTVTYTNNIYASTEENPAVVTVTGKNNYKGTKTANFNIAQAEVYLYPEPAQKAYGAAEPDPTSFDYTLKLKADGTEVANDELHGTVTLQREDGETVNSYKMWFLDYEDDATTPDNYKIANSTTLETEDAADPKRTALFTITGSEETLYLKFKSSAIATKVYGDPDPEWTVADLEVDTEKGGAACDDWDAIKYSFGTPIFTYTEEEGVADAGEYEVTVTGLESPIYPTVEVAPLAFEITARPIAVAVENQQIPYGVALTQGMYGLVEGYTLVGEDQPVVLKTVNSIGTYAPGSVTEDAIIAEITEGNTNYELVEDDCTWGTLTVGEAVENVPLYLWDGDENVLEKITAYDDLKVHAWIKIDQRDRTLNGARTWAAEKYWNTMTLPFDITVAELSQILGYAVVNVVNAEGYSTSETGAPVYKFNLTMKGGYGKDFLPANKPFTIKTTDALNDWIDEKADEDGYLDFGERKIVAPTDEDFAGVAAGGGSTFKPAYAKRPINSADGGKIWFLLGNYTKWAYIKSTSTATWNIVPFEGFIDQSDNNAPNVEAPTFVMEEIDGTTTAIKGVEIENVNSLKNAEGWYNLNGMKLMGAPTQKGVYIQNGKKVIIK